MAILSVVLGVASMILWGVVTAMIASIRQSDAAGRGLTEAFSIFGLAALWLVLAMLLFACARTGDMPKAAQLAAFIAVPAGFAASAVSVGLLKNLNDSLGGFLIIVPGGLPPLAMAYALRTAVPSVRAWTPDGVTEAAVGVLFAALVIAPWPLKSARDAANKIAQEKQHREYVQLEAQQRERDQADMAAKLDALPADVPLFSLFTFLDKGPELRRRALERILALDRRQADAEDMLQHDVGYVMLELPSLGLQATPKFNELAAAFLVKRAASLAPGDPQVTFESASSSFECYFSGMQWLVRQGADLSAAADAYAAAAKRYPASGARARYLEKLDALRLSHK